MLELNKLVYPHMHVSLCIYFEDRSHQMFINGEDSDLQYSHDEELHRAGFAQNSPERDQDCGCAEVCVNHSERRGNKTEIIGLRRRVGGQKAAQVNHHFSKLLSSSQRGRSQLSYWAATKLVIYTCINVSQAVTEKLHVQKRQSYLRMSILILPWSRCQMPCMRRPHCRPKAARSKLTPTLLNPYLFRKVIRNPKPMKIMTWTSWNTGGKRREVSSAAGSITGPCFVVRDPI